MRIDHLGIAVGDLATTLRYYTEGLGLAVEQQEEVATEGVRVAVLDSGEGKIELLQATAAESAIAKFVREHGPGLHHVALRVPDLEAAMRRARAAGLQVLDETPRRGAGGTLVAFIHPKSAGGVLLELVQHPAGSHVAH